MNEATTALEFFLPKQTVLDMGDAALVGFFRFQRECYRLGAIDVSTEDDVVMQRTAIRVVVPASALDAIKALGDPGGPG